MDDKFLKTTIFIVKNKTTKKPIVITHFEGFRDKADAEDFSLFIKEQFVLEEDFFKSKQNTPLGGGYFYENQINTWRLLNRTS